MNKDKVKKGMWVVHTSNAVGKVVWVDPDTGKDSNGIQVEWMDSIHKLDTQFVDCREVMLYVGPMLAGFMVNPGSDSAPKPAMSRLVNMPLQLTGSALRDLYLMNDGDINVWLHRLNFHYQNIGAGHIMPQGNFNDGKAWFLHWGTLQVLTFGRSILRENLEAALLPENLAGILERYK